MPLGEEGGRGGYRLFERHKITVFQCKCPTSGGSGTICSTIKPCPPAFFCAGGGVSQNHRFSVQVPNIGWLRNAEMHCSIFKCYPSVCVGVVGRTVILVTTKDRQLGLTCKVGWNRRPGLGVCNGAAGLA